MITVDNREGSKQYAEKLEARGLTTQLGRLRFGDIQFWGTGPQDTTWNIGIEIKGLKEFCGDLHAPRFTGYQVPGMLQLYDRSYLVIKGAHRPDFKTGMLCAPFGPRWLPVKIGEHRFSYAEFQAKLMTLAEHAGFTIHFVQSDHELVSWVTALHTWWYRGFDSHGSLRVFYEPKKTYGIRAPSRVRRAINALCEGIGWQRTEAIEASFPTVEQLLQADPEDFEEIDGIGPKLAVQLYNSFRREG